MSELKAKILVCDYLGNALKLIDDFFLKDRFKIIGVITPKSKANIHMIEEQKWDWLVIFAPFNMTRKFKEMTQLANIPEEKVVYATSTTSLGTHEKFVYSLVNLETPFGKEALHACSFYYVRKTGNRYVTCTTGENLSYLATSGDGAVMYNTYVSRKTWAANDMNLFHRLAKKYYDIDDSSGYFCDWGANIGTTGIYFLKQLTPNLKLLAFEPDKENYKLLRINLLLNELDEKAVVENFGLGMEESEENFYRIEHNPGGSGMFANIYLSSINMEVEPEKIKIIPPDKYLAEKNISPEEIKYIWIDTEGFEAQVILGAKNLLEKNPAPIFMEFNPGAWNKSGLYEEMTEFLSRCYESYILIPEAEKTDSPNLYPVEKLLDFKNNTEQLGDIFFIRKKL